MYRFMLFSQVTAARGGDGAARAADTLARAAPYRKKVPAPFSGVGTFFLTTDTLHDTMIAWSMSIDPLTDEIISWGVFLFLSPPVPPLGGAWSINRHLPCVLLIVRGWVACSKVGYALHATAPAVK